MGLMLLQQRKEREERRGEERDVIEIYIILNGHTKIDPTALWEIRPARNGVRLVKDLATNKR